MAAFQNLSSICYYLLGFDIFSPTVVTTEDMTTLHSPAPCILSMHDVQEDMMIGEGATVGTVSYLAQK